MCCRIRKIEAPGLLHVHFGRLNMQRGVSILKISVATAGVIIAACLPMKCMIIGTLDRHNNLPRSFRAGHLTGRPKPNRKSIRRQTRGESIDTGYCVEAADANPISVMHHPHKPPAQLCSALDLYARDRPNHRELANTIFQVRQFLSSLKTMYYDCFEIGSVDGERIMSRDFERCILFG